MNVQFVAVDEKGGVARGEEIPMFSILDKQRLWQQVAALCKIILISATSREGIPYEQLPLPTFLWSRHKTGRTNCGDIYVNDLEDFFKTYKNVAILGGPALYGAAFNHTDVIDET